MPLQGPVSVTGCENRSTHPSPEFPYPTPKPNGLGVPLPTAAYSKSAVTASGDWPLGSGRKVKLEMSGPAKTGICQIAARSVRIGRIVAARWIVNGLRMVSS